MVYMCDNETVDGVEYPNFPKVLEPTGSEEDPFVVGDFSSNILSRRIPIKVWNPRFYAGQWSIANRESELLYCVLRSVRHP